MKLVCINLLGSQTGLIIIQTTGMYYDELWYKFRNLPLKKYLNKRDSKLTFSGLLVFDVIKLVFALKDEEFKEVINITYVFSHY